MPKFGGTEFSLEELFILRDKLKDLHPDKQRELLTRYLYSRPNGVTSQGEGGVFSDSLPMPFLRDKQESFEAMNKEEFKPQDPIDWNKIAKTKRKNWYEKLGTL
jgi:hypothetical protein